VLPTELENMEDVAPEAAPETAETAVVPVEPAPAPVPAKVTIVRPGGLGTLMHPMPKPLPEHHRRRAHRHQRVVFVLLLVVCLASAVPITRASYGLRSRGAALGLADGSPVPSGPWSSYSGSAPLGIGGGAGPGITAPGTAGLPVSATPVPVGTRPPAATEPAGGPTPTPKPETQADPDPYGYLPATQRALAPEPMGVRPGQLSHREPRQLLPAELRAMYLVGAALTRA
jgi:hypothetical protein